MRPIDRPNQSYQSDGAVPPFDDSRILLVMDGECALCSGAARRIARCDKADQVRIAPVRSPLGQALLAHYDLNPDDPASWLMVEDGHAYGSLTAILRLGRRLSPAFSALAWLGWLPEAVQDWLYARLARNRYALFGRDDLCALPDEDLRRRLVH